MRCHVYRTAERKECSYTVDDPADALAYLMDGEKLSFTDEAGKAKIFYVAMNGPDPGDNEPYWDIIVHADFAGNRQTYKMKVSES